MTEIRINEAKRTIEVTKAFSKEASKFGTEAYRDLQEVRRDYPNFKVVTRSVGKKNNTFKGLTFEYMEKYIKEHKKENENILVEFYEKCGKNQEGKKVEFAECDSYGEIKKWFLSKYPELEAFTKKARNKVA